MKNFNKAEYTLEHKPYGAPRYGLPLYIDLEHSFSNS